MKQPRINRENAEKLAISALTYLAGEPERLGAFLAVTGVGPEAIRHAAADPAFLSGVLDYVASDEPLLLAVAEHAGVSPETVARAQIVLGGQWEPEAP